ncbi:MAG: type IV secretion system protein [Alphaproteobacteria bacterium]|nr:type IV secretion system protein [Alphaproteobacteria bacterium]
MQWIRRIILVLIWLPLFGCGDPQSKCIEPDDFGYPKVTVFSERDRVNIINNNDSNEVIEWEDSGYIVTGSRPLVISTETVEGSDQWTSWEKGDKDKVQGTCDCNSVYSGTSYQGTGNGVCWFEKGCGLFALIAPIQDDDRTNLLRNLPDLKKLEVAKNPPPPFIVFHVSYHGDNGFKIGSPPRGRLYFKIMDDHYEDNAGNYVARIKDGVMKPQFFIIERLVTFIQDFLDNVTVGIYKQLVRDSEIKKVIQACLVLYIIFTSIMFMLGLIDMTQGELLIRIIKLTLVSLVISDKSWDFFNFYFFSIFTKGSYFLTALYATAGSHTTSFGNYFAPVNFDPAYPMEFFDGLLQTILSPETLQKILAVVFDDFWGIILAIGMYIGIILFVLAIIKATVTYVIAIMVMSFIIILFPLFVCFSLFQITREIFKSYIKSWIAYALQTVFLFAFISLFTGMTFLTLYTNLGFRACWQSWLDIEWDISDTVEDFFSVDLTEYIPQNLMILNLNYYAIDHNAGDRIEKYGDFNCENSNSAVLAQAAKEFPYWNPRKQDGCKRIKDGMNGKYVNFWNVLLFMLFAYLMVKFIDSVVGIVRAITSQFFTQDLYKFSKAFIAPVKDTFLTGTSAVRNWLAK